MASATAYSQSDGSAQSAAVADAAPLEVFEAPRPIDLGLPRYPFDERTRGVEGWVNLNMMIGPDGKPFEISIAESNGIKSLEKAALDQAREWSFTPAKLDGQPVEAAHEIKVTFRLTDKVGASKAFDYSWRALNRAISKKDQPAADTAIEQMRVTNLYEDAYYSLGRYYYSVLWGTPDEQLAWIKRAIAKEKKGAFINDESFFIAMTTQFRLQAATQDFSGALESWKILESLAKDERSIAAFRPTVAAIEAVRKSTQAYAVRGEMGATSWQIGLFKKKFHVVVFEGHIAEAKLRCQKRYVYFEFDPELEYRVADSVGDCTLELVGDPKTKFQLVQS